MGVIKEFFHEELCDQEHKEDISIDNKCIEQKWKEIEHFNEEITHSGMPRFLSNGI